MFGTAYDDAAPAERVKYASANLTCAPDGVAVARQQYGQSHLVLRPAVRLRCTVTQCDSSTYARIVGTLDYCAHVLLACGDVEVKGLLEAAQNGRSHRLLTTYKEVQVHGEIQLARDVEELVLHRRDSGTIRLAESWMKRHGVPSRFL